jgi:hypothetical protein
LSAEVGRVALAADSNGLLFVVLHWLDRGHLGDDALEPALDALLEGHHGHWASVARSGEPYLDYVVFVDVDELDVAAVGLEHWPDFLESLLYISFDFSHFDIGLLFWLTVREAARVVEETDAPLRGRDSSATGSLLRQFPGSSSRRGCLFVRLDGICGAYFGAIATIGALLGIYGVDFLAFGDGFNGAFVHA